MLDEEIDHIIRDAAENHYPPYNDKAWEKMEIKLNKHLPQKKDRRKFIFFLLFFLLLGGATMFTVIQFSGDKTPGNKNVIADNIDENKTTAPLTQNNQSGNNAAAGTPENEKIIVQHGAAEPVTTTPVTTTPGNAITNMPLQSEVVSTVKEISGTNKKTSSASKGKSKISIVAALPSDDLVKNGEEKKKNNKEVKKNTKGRLNVAVTIPELGNDNEIITAATPEKPQNVISKNEEKKETIITAEDKKEKEPVVTKNKSLSTSDKKKPKKNIAGNFGLTFSAGPDLSFIALNKTGKTTLTYGAGLSYNFGKRLTVRTGFYFSKKIYTATPDQYRGVAYPYLAEVSADCKVYEIPVSLSYNFGQRKNHTWFGGAGLSTFLMKTESYDYLYKIPSGQSYNYKYEVSNENKHYFAVLTLSGGYQYHFNKRVSLQAEPYVKLPLSGIGLGKIKLNSSGILFTLTIKPFAKKK